MAKTLELRHHWDEYPFHNRIWLETSHTLLIQLTIQYDNYKAHHKLTSIGCNLKCKATSCMKNNFTSLHINIVQLKHICILREFKGTKLIITAQNSISNHYHHKIQHLFVILLENHKYPVRLKCGLAPVMFPFQIHLASKMSPVHFMSDQTISQWILISVKVIYTGSHDEETIEETNLISGYKNQFTNLVDNAIVFVNIIWSNYQLPHN
jgi:hypothetical protein